MKRISELDELFATHQESKTVKGKAAKELKKIKRDQKEKYLDEETLKEKKFLAKVEKSRKNNNPLVIDFDDKPSSSSHTDMWFDQ
eukprot:Awhi_evm1s15030